MKTIKTFEQFKKEQENTINEETGGGSGGFIDDMKNILKSLSPQVSRFMGSSR